MAAKTKTLLRAARTTRSTRKTRIATPKATPKATPRADTRELLTRALERAFGMSPPDAGDVATTVSATFNGQNEVNDETINAELRSLFYTLEAKRLLSFRREEYENEQGQKLRAFWWRIRSEVIEQLSSPQPTSGVENLYHELPAECWRRPAPMPGAEA